MKHSFSTLRIVDVNLNRAREGLRVIEEVARFILDSDELTTALRKLREKLQQLPVDLPEWQEIVMSRSVETDVGANRSLKDRTNLEEVIHANCCRVEEALRVLEEFCNDGTAFQKMRFKVYELEKECLANIQKKGIINT